MTRYVPEDVVLGGKHRKGGKVVINASSQNNLNAVSLRILALGDSYTIGECVLPEERWPVQLAAKLRLRGLAVTEPVIIAVTGWTTDELWQGMDQAAPAPGFDLVTLLIGVNNQYRGRSLDQYKEQFAALLRRAVTLAGGQAGRLLVLSIPDWGVTPFGQASGRPGISAEIDAFNAANRAITHQAGAVYVDITPISRAAIHDPALLAEDGLHPSGKMYARWVEAVLQVIP